MTSASLDSPRLCPQCAAPLWEDPGFVSWCERCDWNIQPEPEAPQGRLAAFYSRLGRRMGQDLLDSVIDAGDSLASPALAPGNLAALAIAVAVHAVALAVVVIGLLLVIQGWPNILLVGLGLIFLAVAVMGRPRLARMPADLVPRSQAPTLYGLLDEVAAALGAGPIHGLRVTPDFNAGFTQIGPARKAVVALGLPFLSLLNGQE